MRRVRNRRGSGVRVFGSGGQVFKGIGALLAAAVLVYWAGAVAGGVDDSAVWLLLGGAVLNVVYGFAELFDLWS